MIDLMLDDLGGKAVIGSGMASEFLVLKSDGDLTVPFCFPNAGK